MAATKPTSRRGNNSSVPSRKHRNTKKASDVIKRRKSCRSRHEEAESSDSEKYRKQVYVYKVVQHEMRGVKTMEKVKVLGTFNGRKEANARAYEQHEALTAFSGHTRSETIDRNKLLRLTVSKRGKTVQVEVLKEVRDP